MINFTWSVIGEDEAEAPNTAQEAVSASTQQAVPDTAGLSFTDLLTPVHAAEFLGVSRERIKQLRSQNKLVTVHVDGVPFVIRSQVEARRAAAA